MIKLDTNKIYYLAYYPEDKKEKEQRCADEIKMSQEHFISRGNEYKNKIKLLRPGAMIPEGMPDEQRRIRREMMLVMCDAIIMCGDWTCQMGIMETSTAINAGLELYEYEQVIDEECIEAREEMARSAKKIVEEFIKNGEREVEEDE